MNLALSEPLPAPALSAVRQAGVCFIVNSRSFRVSNGRLAADAIALAKAHGADLVEADDPETLSAGLDRCLARGPSRLIVLSGDGTVQFIVDRLARLPAGTPLPQLLLLGGGRTNLTAADLNGRGALLKKLESGLSGATLPVEERETLCIEQTPAPPRHGFFVAAAMIDSAIRKCQQRRQSGRGELRIGHSSTAWSLLRLAVLALLGRRPLAPNPELDIRAHGLAGIGGVMRVLIATTLQHRQGLFDPYAAQGEGGVRLTAVAQSARGFWPKLPLILMGRFTPRMRPENGYLSGRCKAVEVSGLGTYTLDGEKFDCDPTRPVVIRSGPRLRFLVP